MYYSQKNIFLKLPFLLLLSSVSSLVEEPEDNLKCFQRVDASPFVDYEINSGPYSAFFFK